MASPPTVCDEGMHYEMSYIDEYDLIQKKKFATNMLTLYSIVFIGICLWIFYRNILLVYITNKNRIEDEKRHVEQQERMHQMSADKFESNYKEHLMSVGESLQQNTIASHWRKLATKHELIDINQMRVRLFSEMDKYNNSKPKDIDHINIRDTLNDYHHLLHISITDENRADILVCNPCKNAAKCTIFQRNSRVIHYNFKLFESNGTECIARQQILDKIHCFLQHSYNHNDTEPHQNILNESRIKTKYCQFIIPENDQDVTNTFVFGSLFDYNKLTAKYSSLKEELTSNKISLITMEQFMSEYKKAQFHWNSAFRKKHYGVISPCSRTNNIGFWRGHILSLMIHCNFTDLQYNFNKTYRGFGGHENFYHLGKMLKEAVLLFGTSVQNGHINNFYHGVS
eukprot:59079_1